MLLNYAKLTNVQKRAVAALYARKYGGHAPAGSLSAHTLRSLRLNGWLQFDGESGYALTIEAVKAYEAHKAARKVSNDKREELEKIAEQARAVKARLENAS